MKILVLMGVLILTGCSYKNYWQADISKWDGRTPESLEREVNQKVVYVASAFDDWQEPGYTEFHKQGDCEDQATLLGELCEQLGYEVEYVQYISFREKQKHIFIYCNGIYYDSTLGDATKEKHKDPRAYWITRGYKKRNVYTKRQIIRRMDKGEN